jgi:integrase
MFACAEAWNLRSTNPARGIKKFRERRKDRFLDQDEIARLLAAPDDADQLQIESRFATAAIRLLLFTGMRSGEVTSLRWSTYDRQRRCLRLADSKVGQRTIPLSTHAVAILEGLEAGKPDDFIFPGANGVSSIALTRPWYRVRANAQIDQTANLHSLRHTLASWSVMGGLSLAQIGAVLGHKNAQTTLRYADHRVDALRNYAQRVGDMFSAMSNPDIAMEPDNE